MLISRERKLNRKRMLGLLEEVRSLDGPAVTLYVPPGRTASEIEKLLLNVSDGEGLPADLTETMSKSATGAVLFWGKTHRSLVLPPFPLGEQRVSDGYEIAPLSSLLGRDLTIALILVRLGEFAIGVFEGERLLSSKVGSGLVHSRHRQGGSSAQRFERHRAKQMEYFFERVCGHAREHLEPHVSVIDYLIYGGDRYTLLSFRKQCRYLAAFDERTLPSTLDVRTPRQATLERAIVEAYSSRMTEWVEGELA